MLSDFQNFFTGRLTGKFATNSYLNIPPHLKYVATLLCEIRMSGKMVDRVVRPIRLKKTFVLKDAELA